MSQRVTTIDSHYAGMPGVAAAYLVKDDDRAAFVETNTSLAVPRLLQALDRAGMSPEQVEYVIITHIHLDHAGGAGALMARCPNATLIAHPKAAPHAIDPARLVKSSRDVYGDDYDALYGEVVPVPESRVQIMQDEGRLTFGQGSFRFLHTRGHANHHFCVLDEHGGGIFTGDSFGIVYPALQSKGLFAFPSTTPTDFDAEAAKASVDRIVASGAELAYLTHFGGHADLAGIAAHLHRQLDRYATWVGEGDDSGREGEELEVWVLAQVRALFEEELGRMGLLGDPATGPVWKLDVDLNAQGVAFAIKKRRFKRAQRAG